MSNAEPRCGGTRDVPVRLHRDQFVLNSGVATVEMRHQLIQSLGTYATGEAVLEEEDRLGMRIRDELLELGKIPDGP